MEFEEESIEIEEQDREQSLATVHVIRSGDLSQECTVQIVSRDLDSAVANTDYIPINRR